MDPPQLSSQLTLQLQLPVQGGEGGGGGGGREGGGGGGGERGEREGEKECGHYEIDDGYIQYQSKVLTHFTNVSKRLTGAVYIYR